MFGFFKRLKAKDEAFVNSKLDPIWSLAEKLYPGSDYNSYLMRKFFLGAPLLNSYGIVGSMNRVMAYMSRKGYQVGT